MVQIIQLGDGPVALEAGELVTTATEIEPGRMVMGLDEPRFYMHDLQGDSSLIEDPCVHNRICS